MSTFKRCKVVMLSTEKAENCLYTSSNKLNYHKGYLTQDYLKSCLNGKSFHLYIISDEEIKEGDYAYCELDKCVEKVDLSCAIIERWKKVIATTDDSISGLYREYEYQLPQPSQSFIEKYVENYNAGKPITDVLVEYEYESYSSKNDGELTADFKLKTNPKDNCIVIRKIQNSWNKEQIKLMVNKALSESFVGWNEEAINGYKTAMGSIIHRLEKL